MESPEHDYYDHPVFHQDRLRLNTSAIKALRVHVLRWLWTGATGGLITGPARAGKTTAMRWIASELETRDKVRIPCCYVSMPSRDQHTILSVFRQLCSSVQLRVTKYDRADNLSDRFVWYLADRAVEQNCRYVVLIVDEMQRLTPLQFGPFAELHDRLRLLDIQLFIIFVGNDQESTELLDATQEPRYAHIRGRFFSQHAGFSGLTSRQQVHDCLSQYDDLRYPDDGPTYTEYFLPAAFQQGWELASVSGDLWRVFREYQVAYRVESWGMQYFTGTVNTLLSDFLVTNGVEQFDDGMLHECIRVSGLIPSLVQRVQ